MKPSATVEEYLAALPDDVRATLETVRKHIRAAAPMAEEKISYGIPTFTQLGPVVHYGAAKEHCALYGWGEDFLERHAPELLQYDRSKGTLRFPIGKPPSAALIKKLVKARIAENEANATERKAAKSAKAKATRVTASSR